MMQLLVHNPMTHCVGTDRELERLWVQFVKLQRTRREMQADLQSDEHEHEMGATDDEMVETVFSLISCELRRIAQRAAYLKAHRQEDVEYKAVMLSEFLQPDAGSTESLLIASLLLDIRRGQPGHHGH